MRAITLVVALSTLQSGPSAETIVARLHAYLLTYEPQLSALIADEDMRQTHPSPTAVLGGPPTWRDLRSEIAFVRLPGAGPWLGYRQVTRVDGRKIAQPADRLQALLAAGDDPRKAVDIARESARYNLGMARTTNVPTLPLELLHPRHGVQLRYTSLGTERLDGRRLRRLRFEETGRPTLIRDADGAALVSYGEVWVEEGTGRLFQAEVRAVNDRVRSADESIVRVTFAENAALSILVPVRMRETFALRRGGTGQGDARYSNFRRFTTSARIVQQP